MQRPAATAARLGFIALLLICSAIVHGEANPFSKWAATRAIPLTTLELNADSADLSPLKSAIGGARVVALGEPIHGAHEPLAFRNRLLRFLVEEMSFTAVVLEMNVMESATVDTFVSGGRGEAQRSLTEITALTSVPYVETAKLIQWIRDYNAGVGTSGRRKVHFYGIDLPFGGRLGGARRSVDYALAYLSRADAAAAAKISSKLGDALPHVDEDSWGPLSQPALVAFEDALSGIAAAMATNRSRLITGTSNEDYRWALHNLEVARQLAKCFHVTTPQSFSDIRYSGPVMSCRDRAMAENVHWTVENEGPQGRVLVFGHDGHIMNGPMEGGRWGKMIEKPLMMGSHLRQTYGKDLVIIGMIGAATSADLPALKPVEDDIDGAFERVGLSKVFVDLRAAREDPAAFAWLSRPHFFRSESNGVITPANAVDALVFIDRLTPARE